MNRRINRRYQTPLRPDFAHFLIEEQGLSDRQKKVVYQLRSKTQDSQWHYQDAGSTATFKRADGLRKIYAGSTGSSQTNGRTVQGLSKIGFCKIKIDKKGERTWTTYHYLISLL